MSSRAGVITLSEMLAEHKNFGGLDEDDDFAGTSYSGPAIVRASFVGFEEYERKKDSPNPNRIIMIGNFEYERTRISVGAAAQRLKYAELLIAIKEKILAKSAIMEHVQRRVLIVDDLEDPNKETATISLPFIAIKGGAFASPPVRGERDEIIQVRIAAYTQRYGTSIEESLIGV